MTLSTNARTFLLVSLALTSLTLGSCSRERPTPPSEVVICPSTAFIVEKEFELPFLKSKSDKEFHVWAAEGLGKYPVLKNAYSDLLDCWNHYHGPAEEPEEKK